MKIDELIPWLYGRTAGGIQWGLERTNALLAACGDPHHRFRSLHIGGTNGKGSVAALCAAALRSGGHRVALYTSPHLVSITERIQVDGRPIEPELFVALADELRPEIERSGATFFEATTAIAFRAFAVLGAEVAVVEVGLGGRLDATNVLAPEVCAVTNVERDHTEYLGETLAEIAAEKAGIFKPRVAALTGDDKPEVLEVLRARAVECGAPLVVLDEVARLEAVRGTWERTQLRARSAVWGELDLEIPLAGGFQAQNALLAAELLALLPAELRPSRDAVRAGLATAQWPGRMQLHRVGETSWLLDVAHNSAGVAVLCEALDTLRLPRPLVLLVSVLVDKEWPRMLPPLLARADAAVLTVPPSAPAGRRWSAADAARELAAPGAPAVQAIEDFPSALRHAAALAGTGSVLVTGSIHTVGDAMLELGLAPFRNLQAFSAV